MNERVAPYDQGKDWKLLPWVVWLFSVGSLLALVGPVMHESDQASLLRGAVEIARGTASPLTGFFYNYDKIFLSYWSTAAILAVLPGVDVVFASNLGSFVTFWGGMAVLLVARPPRAGGQAAAVSALILAPAFWQHSAFLAANFYAGGLFFLGVAAWSPRSLLWKMFSTLLLGAAVGCRADVLLILPLAAWSLLPRRNSFAQWLISWELWLIVLAGVAAVLFGKVVAGEPSISSYAPFFIPRVYLAYVIFGMGGGGIVLALWVARMCALAGRRKDAECCQIGEKSGRAHLAHAIYPDCHWRPAPAGSTIQTGLSVLHCSKPNTAILGVWPSFHLLLGAVAPLPLFLFYSVQLFSTRHWTALLCGTLACCLSKRARTAFSTGISKVGAWAALVVAIVPIVIGLQLPFTRSPSLVFGTGTIFPTSDGDLTMGGYWFRIREMKAMGFFHDHNQPLWQAAKIAHYEPAPDGKVPLLSTPMVAYYELGATLQGLSIKTVFPDDRDSYYLDSRTLYRNSLQLDTRQSLNGGDLISGRSFQSISPSFDGIEMLLSSPGKLHPDIARQAALSRAFGGNSYRLLEAPGLALARKGHTLVLFSDDIDLETKPSDYTGPASLPAPSILSPVLLRVKAKDVPEALRALEASGSKKLKGAVGHLPEYMSVESLQ